MSEFVKKVITRFFQCLIAELMVFGIMNKIRGKTVTGRKPRPRKETKVHWNKDVELGTNEYKVG